MGKQAVNATHYECIEAVPGRHKLKDRIVNAIIETPKGSYHKYALEPAYGTIAFQAVLPDGLRWPYDFGFVPQTLAPDGDPVDMLLLTEHGLPFGCLIETRVLGVVREVKDDVENDRLIGAPRPSPGAPQATDAYRDLGDIPADRIAEITDFLAKYSRDQGHAIRIRAVDDGREAMKTISRCRKVFKKHG